MAGQPNAKKRVKRVVNRAAHLLRHSDYAANTPMPRASEYETDLEWRMACASWALVGLGELAASPTTDERNRVSAYARVAEIADVYVMHREKLEGLEREDRAPAKITVVLSPEGLGDAKLDHADAKLDPADETDEDDGEYTEEDP